MAARRASALPWILTVLVVAATAGAWWWHTRSGEAAPASPAATSEPEPMPASEGPRYPIDAVVAAEADPDAVDPPLEAGDPGLLEALRALAAPDLVGLLTQEHVASRFVATVDNLPNPKLGPQIIAIRRLPGVLAVEGEVDPAAPDGVRVVLAEANAARYTPYVRAFAAIEPQRMVALYLRAYPQLQQAYRELGYGDRHFNDRMVAVLDHLLAAPEVQGPVELRDTGNGYAFADPALERLSVGHKALVRMGPEHARTVKARLRVLRNLLAGSPPG